MNDNAVRLQMLRDVRLILWIIIGVAFLFHFWTMIFIALIGVITVSVMIGKTKRIDKEQQARKEPQPLLLPKAVTENDVVNMAFEVMQRRISELVTTEYPTAKWVWETPDAKKKIAGGDPVFICLNQAGGYRRAEIRYFELKVTAVIFLPKSDEKENVKTDTNTPSAPKAENYQLMAFEWVDENIVSIGNRMNEAIGNSEESIHLDESVLPIKACWQDICAELEREEIKNTEIVPDGITIKFTQENAERE